MYFITAMLLLFGELMIYGVGFDTNKINNFMHQTSHNRPLVKRYPFFINQGKNCALAVLDGSLSKKPFVRQAYLNNIISFAWYLYAIAIQKGQGFTSGVIVIEDNDQRVYDFLYEYVQQVNPKNLFRRSLISLNPYAYSRQSTHFPSDQRTFVQYGIDARFFAHQKAQRLLPGSKTHLLFGRLAHGLTFVKFERYGLYFKDGFIGHAVGLVRHIGGRVMSHIVTREEKALHKKEYIPAWVKSACKSLPFKNQPRAIKDIVQLKGTDNRLDSLVTHLAAKYDHLQMRHGEEVIISRKEMDDFSGMP